MQVEKDFLMRQFQQLSEVLAQVLFKKGSVRSEELRATIRTALDNLRDGDEKRFHELSLEETVSAVRVDDRLDSSLAFVVADLLVEEAEVARDASSRKCIMQALLLYKMAVKDPEAAVPLHAHERIGQLETELNQGELEKVNNVLLNSE